jgi:uncharacterized protein
MDATVLYHANCYDGFGAAWAVRKALGPDAQYLPVKYGEAPPDGLDRRFVVLVDFSYPRDVLLALAERVGALSIYDHHKTAAADLANCQHPNIDMVVFDMERSGAGIAWDSFHPVTSRPKLIDYVEDRDLWRFRLPSSRAVHAWLKSYPFNFSTWEALALDLETRLDGVVLQGESILRFQSQQVEIMADNVWWQEIGGHRVPVTNATVDFSEVGEALCLRYPEAPFAAYYLDRADGKRQWGLRSRGGFDCSVVAKQYGGGGHPGAAGYVEPR